MYLRAAIGLVPAFSRPPGLPDTVHELRDVRTDLNRLAEYNRVCGFRLTNTLPATYTHILASPLAMRLMTASDFPFPVIGLVHVANRIELVRPIDVGEPLDLSVRAADLRPHDRGRQFDIVATASSGGVEVWRGVSTYLKRESKGGGPKRESKSERTDPPAPSARWRVAPRVGTDYARVSGDHNPIHTSRIGARLFGFPRPIAHGMWSKARCLAALEGRLPEAYTVDVAFKLPILMPATVAFTAAPSWTFALHDAKSGKPHLTGTISR